MDYEEMRIQSMFPLNSTITRTSGIPTAYVIKFHTFYLKLYDGLDGKYRVYGFRYHAQNPVFVTDVPIAYLREYAATFTRDDALVGYDEPCESCRRSDY